MDHDRMPDERSDGERADVSPPDLILQAILPPADAPAEIRAAVAEALSRRDGDHGRRYGWADVSFAASAIALVKGTNQRAEPDTQWVFALSADAPKIGERIRSVGGWNCAVTRHAHGSGGGRALWRASVLDAVSTAPRGEQPAKGTG